MSDDATPAKPVRRRRAGAAPGRSRRDELLDLTIDHLMTNGLNELSLRQLADAIGTSHRMLIYHFGTKENLVSDAVQEVRRRERVMFDSQDDVLAAAEPTAPLREMFAHNTSPEMGPYFRLLYEVWGIALIHPERYGRFLEGIITAWVDAFTRVLRRAGYGSRDARVRATLVLGALRGLQLDLFTTRDRQRVNTAFEALMEMLEREIADRRAESAPGSTTHDGRKAGVDSATEV